MVPKTAAFQGVQGWDAVRAGAAVSAGGVTCVYSGGVPVLCLRALPPLESEEQEDDSDIFAASKNAAGK